MPGEHAIPIAERLEEKGVGLRSILEQIDATSVAGRLFFHMMEALTEFEGGLILHPTQKAPPRRGFLFTTGKARR
jgi:DNA invertase Pin-like site-specific DNA recombinase